MKAKRVIPMALALMFTFTFCGMVFGEGSGVPPPKCKTLPDPKTAKGALLQGFFMAAKDGDHFDLLFLLEGETPSVPSSTKSQKPHRGDHPKLRRISSKKLGPPLNFGDICLRTDDEIRDRYERLPCELNVQDFFNLKGIPVIKELSVERQEFCDTPQDRMIYGTVKIIVVPEK